MNPEDKMRKLMERAGAGSDPSEADWQNFVGRAHRSLRMHRAAVAAGVVALVALAAIGTSVITQATDSKPVPPGSTETVVQTETMVVQTWFVRGDTLWLEFEEIVATEAVGAASMRALLDGPTGPALEEGITSTIPEGTELLGLTIGERTAIVNLSSEFASPSGSLAERARLAQVVLTLTQFDTVELVRFEIEGEPVNNFGSHGTELPPDGQMAKDYEDLLPPIVVESPYPGQEVPATVTVSGTANVFEANVSYRVLDSDGNEVDHGGPGFATATCGTGCRGAYSFEVTVDVRQGTATPLLFSTVVIEVFESSAEDGRPLHVVRVPIRISS